MGSVSPRTHQYLKTKESAELRAGVLPDTDMAGYPAAGYPANNFAGYPAK